jgi:hypothetical protein
MTEGDERLQSRKSQVIGATHEQPQPRSENPWIRGPDRTQTHADVELIELALEGRLNQPSLDG